MWLCSPLLIDGLFLTPWIEVAIRLAWPKWQWQKRGKEDLTIICSLSLWSGCLWNSDAFWTSPDKPAGEHTGELIYPSLPRQGTINQPTQSPYSSWQQMSEEWSLAMNNFPTETNIGDLQNHEWNKRLS